MLLSRAPAIERSSVSHGKVQSPPDISCSTEQTEKSVPRILPTILKTKSLKLLRCRSHYTQLREERSNGFHGKDKRLTVRLQITERCHYCFIQGEKPSSSERSGLVALLLTDCEAERRQQRCTCRADREESRLPDWPHLHSTAYTLLDLTWLFIKWFAYDFTE